MRIALIDWEVRCRMFEKGDCGFPVFGRTGEAVEQNKFQSLAQEGIEVVVLCDRGHLSPGAGASQGEPPLHLVRDQIALLDVHVDKPPDSGVRFTDMTEPFDPQLRAVARQALTASGFEALRIRECLVAGIHEPGLLTLAEWEALKRLGVEAVCEYLPRETRRARLAGLRVLGLLDVVNGEESESSIENVLNICRSLAAGSF